MLRITVLKCSLSQFPLLSLLGTLRHYVSPSLGCVYRYALERYVLPSSSAPPYSSFSRTWSSGGKWPLSPLGNSFLFKTELVPIQDCLVYFPQCSYRLILVKFVHGLTQVTWNYYYIFNHEVMHVYARGIIFIMHDSYNSAEVLAA